MPIVPKEPLFRKLAALEAYVLPAIVVLVGVGAFGLGRLSSAPAPQALRILYPGAALASPVGAGATAAAANSAIQGMPGPRDTGVGEYVASKSGSKYYLPACPGAGRIKEENKVYFASAEEARAAGYSPAANCPGL